MSHPNKPRSHLLFLTLFGTVVLLGFGFTGAYLWFILNHDPTENMAVIGDVEEVVYLQEQPEWLTVTAQSLPTFIGTHQWYVWSQSGQTKLYYQQWVVPLVNPGESLNEPIHLWLNSPNVSEKYSSELWLEQVRERTDGQTLTYHVASGMDPGSKAGWLKAVRDAEHRYGIKSHPKALVLFFPSDAHPPPTSGPVLPYGNPKSLECDAP